MKIIWIFYRANIISGVSSSGSLRNVFRTLACAERFTNHLKYNTGNSSIVI